MAPAQEIDAYKNETLNMEMGVGATKGGMTTVDQTQQTLSNLMAHDSTTSTDKVT